MYTTLIIVFVLTAVSWCIGYMFGYNQCKYEQKKEVINNARAVQMHLNRFGKGNFPSLHFRIPPHAKRDSMDMEINKN